MGPLSPRWQVTPVAHTAIGTNFNKPPDVQRDLFSKVTLDTALLLNDLPDMRHLFFGQILHLLAGVDTRTAKDGERPGASNPINISEANFNAFSDWQINPCNACHKKPPSPSNPPAFARKRESNGRDQEYLAANLALALFVLRVLTDHPQNSATPYELALGTDLFHRRTNFHRCPLFPFTATFRFAI
jgi:hypothetical protein